MVDIDKVYQECLIIDEYKNRVQKIMDKLLSAHDLIFVEMSKNTIDQRIEKEIEDMSAFYEVINQSKDTIYQMNLLKYNMEEYLIGLNLYALENKIQTLQLSFDEIGYSDGNLLNMIKAIRKLKQTLDVDEEKLLIHAYILAMKDFYNRINSTLKKEFKGLDENTSKPILLLRLRKWVVGNKWKALKKVVLKDKFIKGVYDSVKLSYKNCLNTYDMVNKNNPIK